MLKDANDSHAVNGSDTKNTESFFHNLCSRLTQCQATHIDLLNRTVYFIFLDAVTIVVELGED